MQLNELRTILNDLDDLLDLLEAASVLLSAEGIGMEELEEVLAHLVVNDGLAGDLLLLDGELVQDAETEAEREADAVDLVELVALLLEEEAGTPIRHLASILDAFTFLGNLFVQEARIDLRNLD
jgi:hypothetical protein